MKFTQDEINAARQKVRRIRVESLPADLAGLAPMEAMMVWTDRELAIMPVEVRATARFRLLPVTHPSATPEKLEMIYLEPETDEEVVGRLSQPMAVTPVPDSPEQAHAFAVYHGHIPEPFQGEPFAQPDVIVGATPETARKLR